MLQMLFLLLLLTDSSRTHARIYIYYINNNPYSIIIKKLIIILVPPSSYELLQPVPLSQIFCPLTPPLSTAKSKSNKVNKSNITDNGRVTGRGSENKYRFILPFALVFVPLQLNARSGAWSGAYAHTLHIGLERKPLARSYW